MWKPLKRAGRRIFLEFPLDMGKYGAYNSAINSKGAAAREPRRPLCIFMHSIGKKAVREKSTAEARPQRAGDGGSPAQETAERTLLSRKRNAQASMGAGGDRYIAMACQSRKSGPQVVRAS